MAKPPSWNEIRTNAQAFATRWADDTDENAEAQTFWNEFLAIFGVDRKRVATFEARAQRTSTGGRGRIDILWPGVLAAEHKSAGKDLAAAEDQALDYLESIGIDSFPGVVITSDFQHIRVRDLNGDNTPFEFPLAELPKEIDRFGFIAGYRRRDFGAAQEEKANIAAAKLMGALYEQLSKSGYEGEDASVLLTRLLFLLFGDDTGLWEKDLFTEFVMTRTQEDGSDVGGQLAMLFQTLNQPKGKRSPALDDLLARFPYANGGLFEKYHAIPTFDKEMRDELLRCCGFDWGSISPALFGGMFQAVKSREARRTLGEHYTTETNILRVIKPLFLDELHARFERADTPRKLANLRADVGKMRFLDPACGCGNFLVVAYRELRKLEQDIIRKQFILRGQHEMAMDVTIDLAVSPEQFFGIEIEEWPARIAEVAMFLVDHQANLALAAEFGDAPERLPIEITATIEHGNAIDIDWQQVVPASDSVRVFGNPPFIGMALMDEGQQADRDEIFAKVGGGERTGRLDYVASWYAKAVEYLKGTLGRCAFVSTNSITQGEQARTLGPWLAHHKFEIDYAHRTFSWSSEAPDAAAVHVVVVGFSRDALATSKHLYDYPDIKGDPVVSTPKNINIYLADSDIKAIAKHSQPLSDVPRATKGSQPTDGGHLIVEVEDYAAVSADPIASQYLRPLIGARTGIHDERRWCLWLIGAAPADLRNSPVLRERLAGVVAARAKSKTASVREAAKVPALFTQIRQPDADWLWIPRHSSENRQYIPIAFFKSNDIAHDSTLLIPNADIYLFGILQSKMWNTWARTVSGRLESRIRISPDLSYNSFPFPSGPPAPAVTRVESAAHEVLAVRAEYDTSSLADLYDVTAMPPPLVKAHTSLDRAVDQLFRRKPFELESERLDFLFARYEALVLGGELPLD